MRKRTTKSLLAIVMTAVLVLGMAVPGFAAYGYVNGGSDNGTYVDVAAEQTAMPTDLLTHETQITSPAALAIGIQPLNAPPTSYEEIDLVTLVAAGVSDSGQGWSFTVTPGMPVTLLTESDGVFRINGGGVPLDVRILILGHSADIILYETNLTNSSLSTLELRFDANVTLWLEGDNEFTAPTNTDYGIFIRDNSTLTINGSGTLNVTSPFWAIYPLAGSTIIINDGTITATGTTGGFAIVGDLQINGGSVSANTIDDFGTGNITITGNPTITTTGGNPIVWITQQPQGASFTVGSISGNLSVSAHTSQGTTSFQWHQVGVGNVGTNSNTLAIPIGLAIGTHGLAD